MFRKREFTTYLLLETVLELPMRLGAKVFCQMRSTSEYAKREIVKYTHQYTHIMSSTGAARD